MQQQWLLLTRVVSAWTSPVRYNQTVERAFSVNDATAVWGASETVLLISSSTYLITTISRSSVKAVKPYLQLEHSVQPLVIKHTQLSSTEV